MEVSKTRLLIAFLLVFLLGVMFAIVNGYYAEETESQLPLIVYAISFISIIAGGIIVLLFQTKLNKIQLNRVIKILPEPQNKIMKILIENNNSIEQNKLVALTGINKVKISRIISELEFRGIIKRTNLGNTKLIVLTA
ncbi:MAG: hypothetical protein WC867_00900 [Candidatus Pacearchaeota archaeon]|jgi:uncharacterized membrane protein